MAIADPSPVIAQGGGAPPPKPGISEIEKLRQKMGVTPPGDSAATAPRTASIRLVPVRPVRVPGATFSLGDTLESLVFRFNLSPDASAATGPSERVFAGDIRYFSQDAHGKFHFTERWLSRVEIQTGSLTEAVRRFIVDEFLRQGYRRSCGSFDARKVDCDWTGRTLVMMHMDSSGVDVDITLPDDPSAMREVPAVDEGNGAVATAGETLAVAPRPGRRQAIALTRVAPEYPSSAREANVSGTVVVLARVDETGAVVQSQVERSDSGMLDQAALDAVRAWRFVPHSDQGRAVSFWVEVPVKFALH